MDSRSFDSAHCRQAQGRQKMIPQYRSGGQPKPWVKSRIKYKNPDTSACQGETKDITFDIQSLKRYNGHRVAHRKVAVSL